MKTFRFMAAALSALFVFLSVPVANAAESTRTLTNGCQITGRNTWSGNLKYGSTSEVANCASVQLRLQWWDVNSGASGQYVVSSTLYTTFASLSKYTPVSSGYSDHNGKNTTNGTAYGFRISGP